MKQKLVSLLLTLATLAPLVFAVPAGATDIFPGCTTDPALSKTDVCQSVKSSEAQSGNPIIGVIKTVVEILGYAIGVAAIIILVINGLRLAVNGGDVKAAEQSRSGVIYAMVGIAVAVLAQVLVLFVLDKF